MATPDADARARDELATRRIAWAGAAIAGVVLGVVACVLLGLGPHSAHPAATVWPPPTQGMPGPALQSAPQPDLAAYRADKARQLREQGWVDATHQIAHIPIEQAMALLGARSASASASASASGARR